MTESARAAERLSISRAQAVTATIQSLLFENLSNFREGETATTAEQMAASDDLLQRLVAAIDTHFGESIGSYALARQTARRNMPLGLHFGGKLSSDRSWNVADTSPEAVVKRQGNPK